MVLAEQRPDGVHGDEDREAEERHRDDAQRGPLAPVRVGRGELPGHRGGGEHLDERVEPEPDERGRRRDAALGDRDDRLDDVPRDRRRDDPPDPPLEDGTTRGGRGSEWSEDARALERERIARSETRLIEFLERRSRGKGA